MLLLSSKIHGNSSLGREGSSQRRVFTIVCHGTGAGIPHLPQVFREPQILSEEWRNAAQRNVNAPAASLLTEGRSVGWNPLSQQPFPAPAGSSSWPVQPGFPCALSLFQLPWLWQQIPLLPFTSLGVTHTPVPVCPHCPSDVTGQRGEGSVGAVGRGRQGTGALGRSLTAPRVQGLRVGHWAGSGQDKARGCASAGQEGWMAGLVFRSFMP